MIMFTIDALNLNAQQYQGDKERLIDEKIVTNIASAISNPDAMIGLFELPQIGQQPVALKSGIIPEGQSTYIDFIIKYNLIKLNLVTAIKGEFDNVIFIKRTFPRLSQPNTYVPQQIYPFSGSKWLIVLKKAIGSDENLNKDWKEAIYTNKVNTFINGSTLYEFVEHAHGTLCLKWPKEIEAPSDLKVSSIDLVNDLQKIIKTLNGSNPNYEKGIESLSSQYGIAIGKLIFEHKH